MWLVKNNVPFDVSLGVDTLMAQAMGIIFGEFEGGKFNWSKMAFEERKDG